MLFMSSWEVARPPRLDNEPEMSEVMSQLEAKMGEACHSRDISKVMETRKDVSQWMEKYAGAVDQLNGEQRAEIYRKYGAQIDRLKMQLLELYKIRET
jgi:hypothetical protein